MLVLGYTLEDHAEWVLRNAISGNMRHKSGYATKTLKRVQIARPFMHIPGKELHLYTQIFLNGCYEKGRERYPLYGRVTACWRRYPAGLRGRRPAHRADRRRAVHRAHAARRDQRAVRLRPPGQRAAGGAGRPRRARAADPGHAFSAATVACPRPALVPGARRDGRFSFVLENKEPDAVPRNPQLNKNGELIHLLSTEGLPKAILTQILDTAANFCQRERPRGQEGAAAARQERVQPVLREQHAHPHHLRDRRHAPVGRRVSTWTSRAVPPPRARACSTPSPTSPRWRPTSSSCGTASPARPT